MSNVLKGVLLIWDYPFPDHESNFKESHEYYAGNTNKLVLNCSCTKYNDNGCNEEATVILDGEEYCNRPFIKWKNVIL